MNDLITAATSGLFVEVGRVIEHMKVQQERIADLERQLAEASATAVERQQWSHITPRDFVEVATAIMDQHGLMDGLSYEKTEKLCEAMEESFKKLPHPAPQAADTDKVREAIFMAAIPVMAINGMNNFSSWEHECWARGALAMRTEVLGILSDIEAQAPVREVPGWISVKDRLPDMYTEVMVWPHPSDECMTAEVRGDGTWYYSEYTAHHGWDSVMLAVGRVTHWMPLPSPPEADK